MRKIMVMGFALLAAVLAAGAGAQAGGSYPGFMSGRNQGVEPRVTGGIITFTLHRGDCQNRPYGDGRGESDCKNGNSRSRLNAKELQSKRHAYEYSFEFRVRPPFDYRPGSGRKSRLTLSMWQRVDAIKNEMYFLYLDANRGLTFEDRTCVATDRLGAWNSFSMKVFWSAGADGRLIVRCNGREVYSKDGPNLIPPGCGSRANYECKPQLQDLSKRIQWQVGPMLAGYGMTYARYGFPSPFPDFPKSGATIEVRKLKLTRLSKSKVN